MEFEPRFTLQFRKSVKKLHHKDVDKLKEIVADICESPLTAHGTHPLMHGWSGFRAADFDGKNNIVYRVCDECRRLNQQKLHPLGCCSDEAGSIAIITFIDFGDYHKTAGKRRLLRFAEYDF